MIFTFRNSGPAPCSITDVYYDDGVLMSLDGLIDKDIAGGCSGVGFSPLATPANLPGAQNCTPPFETTKGFSADSDSPVSKWGVEPGEWLGVVYSLYSGGSLNDVIGQLASGQLRVGLHVQGFSSGSSESYVHTPEPVSLLLLMLGGGFLARKLRA